MVLDGRPGGRLVLSGPPTDLGGCRAPLGAAPRAIDECARTPGAEAATGFTAALLLLHFSVLYVQVTINKLFPPP